MVEAACGVGVEENLEENLEGTRQRPGSPVPRTIGVVAWSWPAGCCAGWRTVRVTSAPGRRRGRTGGCSRWPGRWPGCCPAGACAGAPRSPWRAVRRPDRCCSRCSPRRPRTGRGPAWSAVRTWGWSPPSRPGCVRSGWRWSRTRGRTWSRSPPRCWTGWTWSWSRAPSGRACGRPTGSGSRPGPGSAGRCCWRWGRGPAPTCRCGARECAGRARRPGRAGCGRAGSRCGCTGAAPARRPVGRAAAARPGRHGGGSGRAAPRVRPRSRPRPVAAVAG